MREMKDSGVEWIGEVPREWNIKRGKFTLKLLNRSIKEDDDVITCFRDGEVTLRKNRREDGFTVSLKEIGYQGIEPGDLVVHGMDGFAGAIGISDSRGKSSPVLVVCDSDENKKYIMYYLRMMAYNDVFTALATGIRVRSCDLRWNKLSELPYILPEVQEQAKIVAAIESNTAKIDALITNVQTQIEKLKEYKQSVITEAVTKGLDPNVPMKDSGVEWIGKIPEHWNQANVGRMCFVTKLAGFEYTNEMNGNITDTGDVPIVRAQNVKMGKFIEPIDSFISSEISARLDRCALDKKCLLITFIGAGIGEVAIFERNRRYHLAPNVAKIVINNNKKQWLKEEYLMYFLMSSSGQEEVNKIKKETAQPSLSMQTIRSIAIVMPPIEEQMKIAEYLNSVCERIDLLISIKQSKIEKLEQYKKSLIYEYVTGKKEVL